MEKNRALTGLAANTTTGTFDQPIHIDRKRSREEPPRDPKHQRVRNDTIIDSILENGHDEENMLDTKENHKPAEQSELHDQMHMDAPLQQLTPLEHQNHLRYSILICSKISTSTIEWLSVFIMNFYSSTEILTEKL